MDLPRACVRAGIADEAGIVRAWRSETDSLELLTANTWANPLCIPAFGRLLIRLLIGGNVQKGRDYTELYYGAKRLYIRSFCHLLCCLYLAVTSMPFSS